MGLTRSIADPCIYYKRSGDMVILIAIYVDDLLIVPSHDKTRHGRDSLSTYFLLPDEGSWPPLPFLGIDLQYEREKRVLVMLQTRYIERLLSTFGMTDQ